MHIRALYVLVALSLAVAGWSLHRAAAATAEAANAQSTALVVSEQSVWDVLAGCAQLNAPGGPEACWASWLEHTAANVDLQRQWHFRHH